MHVLEEVDHKVLSNEIREFHNPRIEPVDTVDEVSAAPRGYERKLPTKVAVHHARFHSNVACGIRQFIHRMA